MKTAYLSVPDHQLHGCRKLDGGGLAFPHQNNFKNGFNKEKWQQFFLITSFERRFKLFLKSYYGFFISSLDIF